MSDLVPEQRANATDLRDNMRCTEVANPPSSIRDDLGVQRASTDTTFFQTTVVDIRSMTVRFNSHSTDLPFQSDEEFSSDGNSIANDYFGTDLEGSRGCDLDPDFSVVGPHSFSLRKNFILVTGHKYRRQFFKRLH